MCVCGIYVDLPFLVAAAFIGPTYALRYSDVARMPRKTAGSIGSIIGASHFRHPVATGTDRVEEPMSRLGTP